jgi:hypothetical protein
MKIENYLIFEELVYQYSLDNLKHFSQSEDNQDVTQLMMWIDPTDGDVLHYIWTKTKEQIDISQYRGPFFDDLYQLSREYSSFIEGQWDHLYANENHPDYESFERNIIHEVKKHENLYYHACMKALSRVILETDFSSLHKADYFIPNIELREGHYYDCEVVLREYLPEEKILQYFPYIAKKLALHDKVHSKPKEDQIKFWIKAYETSFLKDDQDILNQLIEAGYFVQQWEILRENEYKPYYSIESEWEKFGEDMTPYLLRTVHFYLEDYDNNAFFSENSIEKSNEKIIGACLLFIQSHVGKMEDEQNVQSLKELAIIFAKKGSTLPDAPLGYAYICARILNRWRPNLYPDELEFKNANEVLNHPAFQTT